MSAPSSWFSPADRVPRRDQTVRVATAPGVTFQARFVVEHTRDWPSGASWALANGYKTFPFGAVHLWSPDPAAADPDAPPAGAEAEVPVVPEPERDAEPALVREVADEVARAEALLRLMPASQLDWTPHPDLPTLRTLARRLIRIVARIRWVAELDTVEMSFEPDLPALDSLPEIVATYAASAATTAELTATLTGAALRETWTLERNGEPVAQHARGDALRVFGLRPLVYHQAEIALLLTAMELPVPHPYPTWRFAEEAPKPRAWTGPDEG